MINKIKHFISCFIDVLLYGEYPKGWTDKNERDYQAWARYQPDIRAGCGGIWVRPHKKRTHLYLVK